MQPDYILGNNISKQDFEKIAYQWLAEGDYTPDDVLENIITEHNLGLMPLYFLKAEYYGNCSVSLGYRRQEYYYEWDDFSKKQIRKSRTVVDWHPHTQPVQGVTTTITYVGNPLSERAMTFIEDMGWTAEALQRLPDNIPRYDEVCGMFKLDYNESWAQKGLKKAYQEAVQQTIPKLPSLIQSNLTLDIRFTEKLFFSVLAPYWLFKYEYKEKLYFLIADGHTPTRIDGTKPEDKKRKNEVIKIRTVGCSTILLITAVAIYFMNDPIFDREKYSIITWCILIAIIYGISSLVGHEVEKVKDKSKEVRRLKLEGKLKKLKQ